MTRTPTVLGLNFGHDGGAALIRGDEVVAIAEERLSRRQYAPGWQASAIYCLDALGVRLDDVDVVAVSSVGETLAPGDLTELQALGVPADRIRIVNHHLAHAFTAIAFSGPENAVVVVADGAGNDHETESVFEVGPTGLRRVSPPPAGGRAGGLGATYESFTNFIGFHEEEAGKVLALAAYNRSDLDDLPSLFAVHDLTVDGTLRSTHERGLEDLAAAGGIEVGARHARDHESAFRLAAWVQRDLERALGTLLRNVMEAYVGKRILLTGGVAMNCSANGALRDAGVPIEVAPPASDRGQALGSAASAWFDLTGDHWRWTGDDDSFGRTYSDHEIERALHRRAEHGLLEPFPRRDFTSERVTDPAAAGARLLADGKVIGWFQGGSELGARALGHRSILADPRGRDVRERLNSGIKKREWFRPFAPAVLAEHVDEWFETSGDDRFMLFTSKVMPEKAAQIPAVVHVDGTARIQTVGEANGRYCSLIRHFHRLTGVPLVLDTSFNISEPIVETPADALNTFRRSSLDAMIIGDHLVTPR